MQNAKEKAKDEAAATGMKKTNDEHGDMEVSSVTMVSSLASDQPNERFRYRGSSSMKTLGLRKAVERAEQHTDFSFSLWHLAIVLVCCLIPLPSTQLKTTLSER
jgi:hypothetical protein